MSGNRLRPAILAVAGAVILGASSFAFAQEPSSPVPGLKLSGDQPIQIESDKLEVNESKNMAVFTGNVNVLQGETLLKAGRMIVYYKPDATGGASKTTTTGSTAIDRLEVEGKVYVRSGTQVGTGDRGTFDVDANVLVLSGKEVVLSDGPNVLKGCKLTVHMNIGKSDVESCGSSKGSSGTRTRVEVLIQPGSQGQNRSQ